MTLTAVIDKAETLTAVIDKAETVSALLPTGFQPNVIATGNPIGLLLALTYTVS